MLIFERLAVTTIVISVVSVLTPVHWAIASPPVTDGLTVSLDSRGGTTIAGSTWSAQDGTSKNATLQTSTQYDAVNQYVTMNDNTSPNYATLGKGIAGDAINPPGDLTVEAWVKINSVHSSGWNIVATKWFRGPNSSTGCDSGTFHLGFLYGKPNIYTTGAGGQNLNGTTTITDGTWHQLAFTIINPSNRNGSSSNTSGTLALYLDGERQGIVAGSTVFQTANATCEMILGDYRSTGSLGINGGLEKFRMYNRALSADEINRNYRADANIHSLTAGPYNTVIPEISGAATYAATETGTTGNWLNVPTSYSYQWHRSATVNGTYLPIAGATGLTYVTSSADVGKYLKFSVGATNAKGTFYETSTATSLIAKASAPLSFSLANTLPVYRTANTLTVATNGIAGKVSFKANGKRISGCKSVPSNASNSYSASCPWRPNLHGPFNLDALFTPTDSNYLTETKTLTTAHVARRSTSR